MIILLISILALSLAAGQLIRIPIGTQGGINLLDFTVILFSLIGLIKIKFRLKKPPIPISGALIFALIALISLILTPLSLSLPQYFISLSYSLRFLIYAIFAWLVFSGAFGTLKNNIDKIFIIGGISFTVLGLTQLIILPDLGFLQNYGWDPHYFRTVSTFLDPNFSGAFFVLILLIIISSTKIEKKWQKIFLFTMVYLALLTTFSRSSYLAFSTGFLSFSFLKRSFKLVLITLILSAILLLSFSKNQKEIAQPRGIDRARSAISRLETWQQGIIIFQSHPLLGVGFNSYRYSLSQLRLANENFLSSHGASTNDSSLLFVLATTGIIGITSFLFFLYSIIIFNRKNYIVIAGILSLIIQSFFINTLFFPPLLFWLLLESIKTE